MVNFGRYVDQNSDSQNKRVPIAGTVSVRTSNKLEECKDIIYFHQLEGVTAEDLLSINGFGDSGLAEVKAALRKYVNGDYSNADEKSESRPFYEEED